MAKRTKNQAVSKRRGASGRGRANAAGVLTEERDRDVAPAPDDDGNEQDGGRDQESPSGRSALPAASRGGLGFFEVFKPGQGRRTRIGTAVCLGILLTWCSGFVFETLNAYELSQAVLYGVPGTVFVGLALTLYHFLARSRRAVDFLIATEGEMKKVHWSSRKEVIGSTKVVIFVVIAMSLLLFVVDFVLMVFFSEIGVLRLGESVTSALFGGS
ncbi:MAG: preprotein translocase subunit SecE [Phycisphaerae bacterium]